MDNYLNSMFMDKPTASYYMFSDLEDKLKFVEDAYKQLIADLELAVSPNHIYNGRVYFGMDQAVSAPIEEVLENITSWYQFYEGLSYGENLTDEPEEDIIDGIVQY